VKDNFFSRKLSKKNVGNARDTLSLSGSNGYQRGGVDEKVSTTTSQECRTHRLPREGLRVGGKSVGGAVSTQRGGLYSAKSCGAGGAEGKSPFRWFLKTFVLGMVEGGLVPNVERKKFYYAVEW